MSDYNIVRLAKQKEFFTFLSAAISAEELDAILDKIDEAVHNGLKNPKEAAKVVSLIGQLRERRKYCVHTDLFINIIACDLIREDEELTKEPFNTAIHDEKVAYLIDKSHTNPDFFLSLHEYKQLVSMLQISEIPFKELQENYDKHVKLLKESLKIYSS